MKACGIKLIIFDCDGVLLKASWEWLYQAYKAIIKADNQNPEIYFSNLAEFKKWWLPDWRESEKQLGLKNPSNHIFYQTYYSYARKAKGLNRLLRTLVQKQFFPFVFTSGHRYQVEKMLKSTSLFFVDIIDADRVDNLKPHPEGIELILKSAKEPPERAVIIGDMATDLLAGKAAGIKTGAMIWRYGLGSEKELLELEPDFVFRSYQDILETF